MKQITIDSPTTFTEVLGGGPTNRILDFLIENERECWTLTEISKSARVSYPSVKSIMPKLQAANIVGVQKIVGKAKLFRINYSSPIAVRLREISNIIDKMTAGDYLKNTEKFRLNTLPPNTTSD